MTGQPEDAPRWTPKTWMNQTMGVVLRTPGLRKWIGKSTALITITGRRTGREFTTPVSYVRVDDRVLISAHRTRQWWRNLITNPRVQLLLAGEGWTGSASVMDDPDNAFADFVSLIEAQPVLARIHEIPIVDGQLDESRLRAVLEWTVVVSIKLEEVAT